MVSSDPARFEAHVDALEATEPAPAGEYPESRPPGLDEGTVIGLGEGTHGTREFVRLRHRLVQYLVESRGFRTIALETAFVPTLRVDAAVRHGGDAIVEVLGDLGLWVWQTEGLASLLRWVRTFNENRPVSDRVRVVGISGSDPSCPAEQLASLLPELGVTDEVLRENLVEFAAADHHDSERIDTLEDGAAMAAEARTQLEALLNEPTTETERVGFRLCRELEQSCDWNRLRLSSSERFDPAAFERRDQFMAETAIWAHETDPGNGVLIWAHNSHVQRGHFDMPQDWADGVAMGECIHRSLGATYRPLGTTFGRGRYRAVTEDADTATEPRPREAAEPIENSVEEVLLMDGKYPRFLDLTRSDGEDSSNWLDEVRPIRSVPARVDDEADPARRYMETKLPAAFDGLFFVPESSPTRLLAGSEAA